ncbi:MAG: hypothetical protein K9M19_08105 [Candidatus Marinimicrobia bacterium]|nr:hypothetical protein [Candidatus Neomarinimicrobiota bacterium]
MSHSCSQNLHFDLDRGKSQFLRLLGLWLIPVITMAQSVTFNSERITIRIEEQQVRVRGQYYLENHGTTTTTQTLHYPFALQEAGLQFPHTISVMELDTQTPLPFNRTANAIVFPVTISPTREFGFQVDFTQSISRSSFTYILTTTQSWHRPLEQAEFVVIMAPALKLTGMSLPYDYEQIQPDGRHRYLITRVNFMPDENLVITWEGELP